MILAALNQSSALSSAVVASSSGRSGPAVTTSPTPTVPAAANTTGSGITESDKISLGIGIGIGFPSFVAAFFSAWIVYRSIQRRRGLARRRQEAETVAVEREASSVSTNSSDRAEVNEGRTQ